MSEPTGFVDTDPFDPAAASRAEAAMAAGQEIMDDVTRNFVFNRARAYKSVFSAGGCTQGDLEFVLADLAHFCRAFAPTWNRDQKVQDLLEGRREVFYRIFEHTQLTPETLFVKVIAEQQKVSQQ